MEKSIFTQLMDINDDYVSRVGEALRAENDSAARIMDEWYQFL